MSKKNRMKLKHRNTANLAEKHVNKPTVFERKIHLQYFKKQITTQLDE